MLGNEASENKKIDVGEEKMSLNELWIHKDVENSYIFEQKRYEISKVIWKNLLKRKGIGLNEVTDKYIYSSPDGQQIVFGDNFEQKKRW